jgi:lipoate-protein ligase A
MSDGAGSWRLHEWRGTAADFHSFDPPGERAVWWCRVEAPALILGSSQTADTVSMECAADAGLDIVRRRSGGGVVFVHPDDSVWIDVTIPRDDPLWTDDVGASMLWLGDVFVDALSPWIDASVHRGEFDAGESGRDVCFASTSPGEVFAGEAKVVGISQRRTRNGSRFQCALYREWNPDTWAPCLASESARRAALSLQVSTVSAASDAIVSAVMHRLNR